MKQDTNLNNHQFIFPIFKYDKEKKEYYLTSKKNKINIFIFLLILINLID